MSDNYKGVLIQESLENTSVLGKVKIISTDIEKVTQNHQTPWLSQWTKKNIEIVEDQAADIAREISGSLDKSHNSSWYADFKNKTYHYIIFPNKIFKINRKSKQEYEEAKSYGISIGIPEHQLISADTQDYTD